MKYRGKNTGTIIEAFKWDPTKPASTRPDWFNQKVNSGEVIIETTDAVSLPFPATRSALPGEFIVQRPDTGDLHAYAMLHGWEPVEE
jgi:hypothetical protein